MNWWMILAGAVVTVLSSSPLWWPAVRSRVAGKVHDSGKGAEAMDAITAFVEDALAKLKPGEKPLTHDGALALLKALHGYDPTLKAELEAIAAKVQSKQLAGLFGGDAKP